MKTREEIEESIRKLTKSVNRDDVCLDNYAQTIAVIDAFRWVLGEYEDFIEYYIGEE